MHIHNRLLAVAVCTVMLVPSGTFAYVSLAQKQEAASSLQTALERAARSYRTRTSLQSLQTRNEQLAEEEKQELSVLEDRQRLLRAEILSLHATIDKIQRKYVLPIESATGAMLLFEDAKSRFAELLKASYVRSVTDADVQADARRHVVSVALREGSSYGAAPSLTFLLEAQVQYLHDLTVAAQTYERLEALHAERERVLALRAEASRNVESVERVMAEVGGQMDEIRRITADVHEQVLKLQGELARIDERLRTKAQRALIQKGLLDPSEIDRTADSAKRPPFSWPVYGPVSAGFRNSAYHEHFGVPHHGTDIVVGQGTPVASSAEGVVFLVRDGGEKGYTYVLIGHRNGYATLYGHLSSVSVAAGQEVSAGQFIGLSGGKPGTPGAGPMTTGPHLHFEVIRSGENVDPLTVLPQTRT